MGTCCSPEKNKDVFKSIDDFLKLIRERLKNKNSPNANEKEKNDYFTVEEIKSNLNNCLSDLNKERTQTNEDKVKNKMKDIKLCLSEILEAEGKLPESIIQMKIAQKYCDNPTEKKEIDIKIQKILSKIYDSNTNQVYKDKNLSKTLSQISTYVEIDDSVPSLLDLNDLYDFPQYYNEVSKKDLTYEKEILDKFRENTVNNFREKCLKNSLTLEDIEVLNCILCKETKEEFNILSDLLYLIKRSEFFVDDHFTGIAITLENPYLTSLSMTNISIILEIFYNKLEKLNLQDIIQNPKNNNFISLFRGMARILNLISDMSSDLNTFNISEEFHKKLIDKIKDMKSETEENPLLNFHVNYTLQSLLRVSDGTTVFGRLFNRIKKCKDGILDLIDVYENMNPAKLYDAYLNFKESFNYDKKDPWFDYCRQIEFLIKTGGFYYLEAEIQQKFKEKKIDYFYLFCIILELNKEYKKIIDSLKIFKFKNNNFKEINIYHDNLVHLIDLLLNKIVENENIDDKNKEYLIDLIIDAFADVKNEVLEFLKKNNKDLIKLNNLEESTNDK